MTKITVYLPHFFRDGSSSEDNIYGSSRKKNSLSRSIAFSRCIESILSQSTSSSDLILNIAKKSIEQWEDPSAEQPTISIDVVVLTDGFNLLKNCLEPFRNRIKIETVKVDDSRELPSMVIHHMLQSCRPDEYVLYMEDDLIINDPSFLRKALWFTTNSNSKDVLMPHRFEKTHANYPKKLYIDGPINSDTYYVCSSVFDELVLANGRFLDQKIRLVEASNPHAGYLFLSYNQCQTALSNWPPCYFVGPLETACTGLAIKNFKIWKVYWGDRTFFEIEHGNPSFLKYISSFPLV